MSSTANTGTSAFTMDSIKDSITQWTQDYHITYEQHGVKIIYTEKEGK